jgi:hypothetical protein
MICLLRHSMHFGRLPSKNPAGSDKLADGLRKADLAA